VSSWNSQLKDAVSSKDRMENQPLPLHNVVFLLREIDAELWRADGLGARSTLPFLRRSIGGGSGRAALRVLPVAVLREARLGPGRVKLGAPRAQVGRIIVVVEVRVVCRPVHRRLLARRTALVTFPSHTTAAVCSL
jgi:hypothetical protein